MFRFILCNHDHVHVLYAHDLHDYGVHVQAHQIFCHGDGHVLYDHVLHDHVAYVQAQPTFSHGSDHVLRGNVHGLCDHVRVQRISFHGDVHILHDAHEPSYVHDLEEQKTSLREKQQNPARIGMIIRFK